MAMNFSFNYARLHGGVTLLRYDDTNPETMKEEYVKGIREMVEWLGECSACYTYYRINAGTIQCERKGIITAQLHVSIMTLMKYLITVTSRLGNQLINSSRAQNI